MKIVIFGHVCIDHNISEGQTFTGAGSPAMFMHRIFSQLPDCNVTIIAPYGPDFSHYVGMTRFYPEQPLPIETMIYENTVVDGVRTQRCLNYETATPIAIDGVIRQAITDADSICVAPLAPNFPIAYVREIATLKKWKTEITLLPQGYFRQFNETHAVGTREFIEAIDIVPLVDTVIISDADYDNAAGVAAQWATQSTANIVMTQAERGATLFTAAGSTPVLTDAVAPHDIVSSIGAGDIFSAGYIYSFAKTHDAVRAISFGNALARQCLSYAPDAIRIDLKGLSL